MPALELVLVVNPEAGAGRARRLLPRLLRDLEANGAAVELRLTEARGHATELVRNALVGGAPGVAVVGGDGTLNEAVNGFFDEKGVPLEPGAWLAPMPCGTGGDFRRTLGLPTDVSAMAARVVHGKLTPLDVGWMSFLGPDGRPAARAFLNIASFGLGGEVDRVVNEGPKWLGGRLTFLLGTLRAMAGYRNRAVRLRIDDGEPWEGRILNVAIANGRYFGGGMHIAPRAQLDDGLFDVVAIEREGAWANLALAPQLYRGTLLDRPGVFFARGRTVIAEPTEEAPVLLDVDGEAPGQLPATFEMRAGALTLR